MKQSMRFYIKSEGIILLQKYIIKKVETEGKGEIKGDLCENTHQNFVTETEVKKIIFQESIIEKIGAY